VAICLAVELALNRWFPILRWSSFSLAAAGVALIGAGLTLILWAAGLFRRTGTGIVPFSESTALVTNGPYRFTRNPMYLGMATILLGAAAVMGSPTPLFGPIAFIAIITTRFIVPEEAHMERAFGASYLELKRRVRRWL
jgi:protein-S-isoprenylcysteine O-methyltransferase Ste14